jgi:glucose/mannose-6-phosphate isomerase
MNFIEQVRSFPEQILRDKTFQIDRKFNKIVISGMGGSGIVGRIFAELYEQFPVQVVSDYKIPDYVDRDTLFIAISYSGNTEETLSTLKQAETLGAQIKTITSGGELGKSGFESVMVPSGMQPRNALGYMLAPLLRSILKLDAEEIKSAASILREIEKKSSYLKEMAENICSDELIPWIVGYEPYIATSYRWKTQFNENGKILAVNSVIPELNHNETMPLKMSYGLKRFYFITLGNPMNERTARRLRITSELTGLKFHNVMEAGNTKLQKILSMIHSGDYISYYVSEIRGLDPMDVSLIEELKKRLS